MYERFVNMIKKSLTTRFGAGKYIFFERSRSGYADSAEENEGIRNGSGKEEGMEIKEV